MADQSGYANTRRVKDCREDAVKDRDAEKVGERAARSPLMAWFRVSSAACQDLLQELKNPYYVGDQPTASARFSRKFKRPSSAVPCPTDFSAIAAESRLAARRPPTLRRQR
jgi:hypothetical protein